MKFGNDTVVVVYIRIHWDWTKGNRYLVLTFPFKSKFPTSAGLYNGKNNMENIHNKRKFLLYKFGSTNLSESPL